MPVSQWCDDFFFGPFGELQLAGIQEEAAPKEVDFLTQALALEPGAEILDVPCGTGRHSLELARRGYRVTGVDFNPKLVAEATRRAKGERLAAEFVTGDMRKLAYTSRFVAAICVWGSFGYFDAEGDRAAVAGVFRSLVPGGRFLLEGHVAETLFRVFTPRSWSFWGAGEARTRVLEERVWNLEAGRVDATWTFIRSGVETSRQVSLRIYTYCELVELLRSEGFREFSGLETLSGKPFDMGSSRLSLVATK